MIAERLTPAHILAVELQPAQAPGGIVVTPQWADYICSLRGVGWTLVEDSQPIGCGGIIELWENRAQAWSILSLRALARFRHVHRMVRDVLDDSPWRRIEMDVDIDHAAGAAWARHLGFECEGLRRKYTVDGRDTFLFARVK